MSKIDTFRQFVGPQQRQAIYSATQGEEGDYFRAKVKSMIDLFETMPKIYEQDGVGDEAKVYLHYFTGGCDWYITERDMEGEQHQAFGYANLGDDDCAELGYISIAELIANGAELDMYWTPVTLGEIKVKQAA